MRLEMTYLVITRKISIDDDSTNELISKLWKRDIDSKVLRSNPDFHIINPQDINSIGIEQIKELQEEMRYKPFQERVQIAVILDAKKLTVQAQNAFLKTLEDSPDTTVYILLTGNEKDLLPTIVSRSKKLYSKARAEEKVEKGDTEMCFESDDLVYCFSVFEKLAKDKQKTLEYLDRYLDSLHDQLKNGIKKGTDIEDITERISLVNITKGRVGANGNRRLLLENLYLQIQNIE
jgi:hypothetical protein